MQIGGRINCCFQDFTVFFNILQYFSSLFSIFQHFPILFSICSIFQYISKKTASINCKLEGGSPPFYRKRCQGKDCEALCFNLHNISFTKNNGNFTKSSSYAQEEVFHFFLKYESCFFSENTR